MYLIFALVFGLLMFVLVYARYMRALGVVNRRNEKFEIFQDKISRRIKGLQAANAHLKREIQATRGEIEKLERQLQDSSETYAADESGKPPGKAQAPPLDSEASSAASSASESGFDDFNMEDPA